MRRAAPWRAVPGDGVEPRFGCAARAGLHARLEAAARSRAAQHTLLLVADIDGFRAYNARHGYAAGDVALDCVGRALAGCSQAYHLGSDTFAGLLNGTPLRLAQRLAPVVSALTVGAGDPLLCSFGAVLVPLEGSGGEALALAEERLDDQRRRGLAIADRVTEVLLALMHAHDPELRLHVDEVSRLADAVAQRLGLGLSEQAHVRRTAVLHDVGKLAIGPEILGKPGPLDDAEWAEIRRHTIVGDELLRTIESLRPVASLIRATHERFDGAGYPEQRQGDDIPLAARIVAACDAYHAMISTRPYAPPRTREDACAELEANSGTQFDPTVVGALLAEIADERIEVGEAIGATTDAGSVHGLARLHALLDSASLVEDPDELPGALDAVARVVGETLGYGAVVINLYRHEWDDFVVSTVHGDDPVLTGLLGSTYDWAMWEQVLQPRFLRGGAYTVYAGDFDWGEQSGNRVVPDLARTSDPDAWQGEDEIFVPFRHTDGHILGIFNVGLPRSGRRPSNEELHVLTTVVRHAARAVQRAQYASAAAAHRRTLERLMSVSSRLTQTASGNSVLEAISVGISEALGFNRVVVYLHERETGGLTAAAAAGFELGDPRLDLPFGLRELEVLFDHRYEVEGCYLVPLEEAEAQLPSVHGMYQSAYNGRGRWAWQRHWLAVPLTDWSGACLGVVFADDPRDRLLPSKERLQALRLFANQATVALESVSQFESQRYLAEHDGLTSLRNRYSFMRELGESVQASRMSGTRLALVYCDLDSFKQLNDAGGHLVGDRALQRFAAVLKGSVRGGDAAFRIGGDEFALLLHDCSLDEAREIVERTMSAWAAVTDRDLQLRGLSASFGIAALGAGSRLGAEALLHRADEAMYEAKRSRSRLTVAA